MPWSCLGTWSGKRVALVSAVWVLLMFAVTIARALLAARAYRRAHPEAEMYIVGVGTPGGLPAVVGPPIVLLVAWLWARRRS